ncbi:ABC transporter substrate-binding protein [Lacibacterium aquatile]|uniref:ABC transporter substrate-binding protein n=1 Tax=Lacibacterium aquatile TaxID=1168082 RepID=A0ABW5DUR7_9PROT
MRNKLTSLLLAAGAASALICGTASAQALKVFVGGQQRPDVMKQLFDIYERETGQKVELEVGGTTSEAQQQYLTTVLSSKDASLDVFLIDIVRPAQYAAAGWAEPLDPYIGANKAELLKRYLPAYAEANNVNGKLVAMPAFADAMFLYYRKDLLEKHGVQPPKTWDEMVAAAQKITGAEGNPNLQGFSYQGAKIEGATCTFMIPFWGKGAELLNNGKPSVNNTAGKEAFQFLLDLKDKSKVSKSAIAEVTTEGTRLDFQAGNVVFAQLWGYGWNRFQADDSSVKGKVGVVPLPSFAGGKPVTCVGGWQWAVSSFSKNKEKAANFVMWMSGPRVMKELALRASNLPAIPEVYKDPEVLKSIPWFEQALPVVQTARARPVSPRYTEVSETIQSNVNAVLAGVKTPDAALSEIDSRLARIYR